MVRPGAGVRWIPSNAQRFRRLAQPLLKPKQSKACTDTAVI